MKKVISNVIMIFLIMLILPVLHPYDVFADGKADTPSEYIPENPWTESFINDNGEQDLRTIWDCIYFGSYYQNSATEKEPIKWRVLSVNRNDAFLLADEVLDCKAYHDNPPLYNMIYYSNWEISSLRAWLNSDFMNTAFNEEEKNAVLTEEVLNPANPHFRTDGGNNTTDQVYLLSIQDASNEAYGFNADFSRKSNTRACKNTWYAALNRHVQPSEQVPDQTEYQFEGNWMTRSPGKRQEYNYQAKPNSSEHCAVVNSVSGIGDYEGIYVNQNNYYYECVRPCLHLDLSSDTWQYAGKVWSDDSIEKDMTSSGILQQGDGWSINWECNYKESVSGEKKDAHLRIFVAGSNEKDGYLYTYADGQDEYDPGPWISETGLDKDDFLSISVEGTSVNPLRIRTEQFKNYTSLEELSLSNVVGMDNRAFENCTMLQTLDLPSSVQTIGDYAFQGCESLEKIEIPDGIITLGKGAFLACTGLKQAVVSGSLKWIPDHLFASCTSLESFVVEDDIEEIGVSAFEDCSALNNIRVTVTLSSIKENAFSGCKSLREVYYGGTSTEWDKIQVETGNESLTAAYIYCNDQIEQNGIGYHFKNDKAVFQYGDNYKIPLKIYKKLFSSAQAEELYKAPTSWGGNCHGMSLSSALFHTYSSGVRTTDFNHKTSINDLQLDDKSDKYDLTVKEFIEMMQISVQSESIQKNIINWTEDINGFRNTVKGALQNQKLALIILAGMNSKKRAEHTVLAYRIDKISETEERIYVYDPNRPNHEDYIVIRLNSDGKAVGWEYGFTFMTDWGSGKENAALYYVPMENCLDIWKNSAVSQSNLLSVKANSFDLQNADGELLASIRDGEIVTGNDVVHILHAPDIEYDGTLLYCPGDEFVILNRDSDQTNLEASLAGQYMLTSVRTVSSQIHYTLNEGNQTCSISVQGKPEESFTASIVSYDPENATTIGFNGVIKESTCTFGLENGKVVGEDNGVTVIQDGKEITSSQNTSKLESTDEKELDSSSQKSILIKNPMTAKGKTIVIKHSKLAKKSQKIKAKKLYKIRQAKGKLSYKLVSVQKGKYRKYFSVNARTGKIKVKKGLKKGTYKLKIRINAAGNMKYKSESKVVKVKIKVK